MGRRSSMGRRQIVTTGEQDAFTRWRRLYCYLDRAGATSKIKRGARRRERREGKQQARMEDDRG